MNISISDKTKELMRFLATLAVFSYVILFPFSSIYADDELQLLQNTPNEVNSVVVTEDDSLNSLPEVEYIKPRYTKYVEATAYSSTPDQTDDTPCITANGFNVCKFNTENVIATNALPFGTKVRFPDLYGDRVFIVMDRMNARYTDRVDFWKKNRDDAWKFGYKYIRMEVL